MSQLCYDDCSALNITTCQFISTQDNEQGTSEGLKILRMCPWFANRLQISWDYSLQLPVKLNLQFIRIISVSYDDEGCYDPGEYMAIMNRNNSFQHYSNFIGYVMIVLGSFGIIGKFCILIVLTFSSLLLQETFCLLLFCLTRKRSVLTISSLLSTSLTPSILCLQCWMLSGTIIKITILRVCWQYFPIFITQSTGIVSLFVPTKTSNHTVCPIKVRIYSAGEYLSMAWIWSW